MFNSASLAAAIGAVTQLAGEVAVVAGVDIGPKIAAVESMVTFVTDLIGKAEEAKTVLTSDDQAVVDDALAKIKQVNADLRVQAEEKLKEEGV